MDRQLPARLCREIGRSKLAPQGICVVNSAGKVLAWTMAFDDDKSVLAFLDHARKRFARYPDAKQPATSEALKAEIEALKSSKVAWREIAWKSCLLEGLKESRAQNKPALLWVFIDRPTDDARC